MPPSPKRTRRSPEQARTLILQAARHVFAARGPDAVGLKDIAREAGVSHGLITHYFGTYEGLVEATLLDHITRIHAQLLERLSRTEPTTPGLVVNAFMDVLEDPLYARLMAWSILSGRYQSAEFFPRRERAPQRTVDAIEAWLDARGVAGLTREDVELLMIVVFTAGMGYGMGREALWESLGKRATAARDRQFRQLLVELISSHVQGRSGL